MRHKKLHPSYWYNNFAKLCRTVMINFLAYRCTWEYPIACLFDSLCRIENWEPAYQICYWGYCLLSSRQQRKMWNSCCNARPQTSSLQTYGLLTVLNLILWITGYVEYCSNVFIGIRKSVKNWMLTNWSSFWLKRGLASSKMSLIGQLTNGEFTLMHASKPKESILKTCYDVLFHKCQ